MNANATDHQQFIVQIDLLDDAVQFRIAFPAFHFFRQQGVVAEITLDFHEHAILKAALADVVKLSLSIQLNQHAINPEGAGRRIEIVDITGNFNVVVVVKQVVLIINFLGEQDIAVCVELTFHLNRKPVLQLVQTEIVIRDRAGVIHCKTVDGEGLQLRIQVLDHAFKFSLIHIVKIRAQQTSTHEAGPEAAVIQPPAAYPNPIVGRRRRKLNRCGSAEYRLVVKHNHLPQQLQLSGAGSGIPGCRNQRPPQGVVIEHSVGLALAPLVPATFDFQHHAFFKLALTLNAVVTANAAIGRKPGSVDIHATKTGHRTNTGALGIATRTY